MQNTIERIRTDANKPTTAENLNFSRIILIGCGGVGSFIAQHLGLVIGVEALLLVDGDTYERKNTNRQALAFGALQDYKVEALLRSIGQPVHINSIDVVSEYITESNWDDMLNEFNPTLIICAVDNDEARKLIFAKNNEHAILWGANELWTPQAGLSLPSRPWNPMEAFQAAEEAGTACGIQTVHANACAASMAMQLLHMHASEHEDSNKLPVFMSKQSNERTFTMTRNEI